MKPEKARFITVSVAVVSCIMLIVCALAIAADTKQVIQITAKRFVYSPKDITVKKGLPVVLEFTSLDRLHGFSCPELGIRTDIPPKKVTKLRFVPQQAGTFQFHCDIFCGSGHEGMAGTITVTK
jgi:cytochrome c oxidase subunit II